MSDQPKVEARKIPLVFSVTGHRDLPSESVEPLKEKIRAFFYKEILPRYKNSPLTLITALAEGAVSFYRRGFAITSRIQR